MSSYGPAVPSGLQALLDAVLAVGLEDSSPARRSRRRAATTRALAPVPRTPPPDGSDQRDDEVWGLVEAAQGGNLEAFGRLYDRYVTTVHRYAYARLGDRMLAEDVTSETFLRALRRIGTVTYMGRDVGAWFVTIARNLILDHVKSGRARYEVTTGEQRDVDRPVFEGPEAAAMSRLGTEELLRCVRRLAPDQQECIVLRFLHGLSVAETAEVMERNAGAVKALQHRAVRRLAELLPKGVW
jgi:RNA polymerase sigma-70 factor (ECF subfamily)